MAVPLTPANTRPNAASTGAAATSAENVASRFPAHSLALFAQRRLQQLLVGLPLGARAESVLPPAFAGSALLPPAQGTTVLLNLPSPSAVAATELIFATWQEQHGRGSGGSGGGSLSAMHAAVEAAGCSEGGSSSTVVLVRAAPPRNNGADCDHGNAPGAASSVFGAFAPQGWIADGVARGTPKAFLFSMSHDRKLPFHGRQDSGAGGTVMGGGCVCATASSLRFGAGDLVLGGPHFEQCSSALEHTFGFGMQPDCPEAGIFLAGAPAFRAEEVEVWAIRNQNRL